MAQGEAPLAADAHALAVPIGGPTPEAATHTPPAQIARLREADAPRLLAFDLETTGLDAERSRIVEFCFIELDQELNEVGRWSELVHPGMPIPEETVKVHGITDGMVMGRPTFRTYAARIQALVQGAVLVAHNHKFDLQVLARELRDAGQAGLPPNHPCIDTWQVEALVNSHSLGETYKRYLGADLAGAHRSAADTVATVAVLRAQRLRHAGRLPASIDGLVVPNLLRHFRPEAVERQWLDHGRRFYVDGQGTIRFGFGKYRDQPALAQRDYLQWMRDRGDFQPEVKLLIQGWLAPVKPTVQA